MLLLISTTRLIIATINVQKRNNVSQVMYIGITPLFSRKANKIDLTSSLMRKQPPPYDVLRVSYDTDIMISLLWLFVKRKEILWHLKRDLTDVTYA